MSTFSFKGAEMKAFLVGALLLLVGMLCHTAYTIGHTDGIKKSAEIRDDQERRMAEKLDSFRMHVAANDAIVEELRSQNRLLLGEALSARILRERMKEFEELSRLLQLQVDDFRKPKNVEPSRCWLSQEVLDHLMKSAEAQFKAGEELHRQFERLAQEILGHEPLQVFPREIDDQ